MATTLEDALATLEREGIAAAAAAEDLRALEDVRVRYLGRKSQMTEILRGLPQLDPAERKTAGQRANAVKNAVTEAVDARKQALEREAAQARAHDEAVDVTLPGRRPRRGHQHLITRTTEEILEVFQELGFQTATGPDIETEYYNFDALNTPEDHPARDTHDTFFVQPGVVLRTHTSPVQMRVMENTQPPVAVVVPGRVYRVDYDATHSPVFCQVEGLLVDEGVTFGELKGTLEHFIRRIFGPHTKARFRPHFFPFTEPSAEVDIWWEAPHRETGAMQGRWLEILGCGMVDPEVFRYAGYDAERYSGFAFGMGVDRIAMVRHGINSIHHLYENDLRFLEQF